MSIHSALQKFPAPSLHQLEKSIDGNLCRCTGYRPIVDALRYAACAQPTLFKCCIN
jgi:xanthine dehydrogenase/oxidase